MDQFRAECKAKGYMQPSEVMKINGSDVEITSMKVKRSLSVRLIRSGKFIDNETVYSMSTSSQDYDDNNGFSEDDGLGGRFHPPVSVPNEYLEAICGNLSGK